MWSPRTDDRHRPSRVLLLIFLLSGLSLDSKRRPRSDSSFHVRKASTPILHSFVGSTTVAFGLPSPLSLVATLTLKQTRKCPFLSPRVFFSKLVLLPMEAPAPVPVIPPRYVQELRRSWDGKLAMADTLAAFRECVVTVRHHANLEYNHLQVQLHEVLSVLGNTRHREALQESGALWKQQRTDIEAAIDRWTAVQSRCGELLSELEEHVGNFTDVFFALAKEFIAQVREAPWGQPSGDPWSRLSAFYNPHLLEVAREVPPVIIDSSCFTVTEAHRFDAAASHPRKGSGFLCRPYSLKITCCTTDAAELPELKTLYIGTENGSVLGFPIHTLFPPSPPSRSSGSSATEPESEAPLPKAGDGPTVVTQDLSSLLASSAPTKCLAHHGSSKTAAAATITGVAGASNVPGAVSSSTSVAARHGDQAANSATHGQTKPPTTASRKPNAGHAASGGSQASALSASTQPGGAAGAAGDAGGVITGGIRAYRGHLYAVLSLTVCRHGGASLLVSSSADKTVRVSNATTGVLLSILVGSNGVVTQTAYHRELRHLLTCSFDGSLRAWDTQLGDHAQTLVEFPEALHSLHVDISSNVVYVGTRGGHLYGLTMSVPSAASKSHGSKASITVGDCRHAFLPDGAAPIISKCTPKTIVVHGGHRAAVTKIASIGGFLFSGDSSGLVKQWDAVHSIAVRSYRHHVDDITDMTLTADGFLFTTSKDALLLVWNTNDGTLLERLNTHFGPTTGVVVGVVPRYFPAQATAKDPSAIAAAAVATAVIEKSRKSFAGDPASLSHVPDGFSVVALSSSVDENVVVWNLTYAAHSES